MFEGSLILGITLLAFAGWLQWNERQGWPEESDESKAKPTELERNYRHRRMRSRRRIHLILGICGILILVAAFAGPGRVWIGAWMSVMVALLTIVMLAGLDVIRTRQFQRDQENQFGQRTQR